jgi:hypothetical protein
MTDQQRPELLPQSSSSDIAPSPVRASGAGWQQEKWNEGQEKEWEARLRNLEQYICELLIKNQQLRELLGARPGPAGDRSCQSGKE